MDIQTIGDEVFIHLTKREAIRVANDIDSWNESEGASYEGRELMRAIFNTANALGELWDDDR